MKKIVTVRYSRYCLDFGTGMDHSYYILEYDTESKFSKLIARIDDHERKECKFNIMITVANPTTAEFEPNWLERIRKLNFHKKAPIHWEIFE